MTGIVTACRFCGTPLEKTFVDLGASPLANSYLSEKQLNEMEPFYPLHTYICSSCFLVQLPEVEKAEAIFTDYAYFSSFSDSWLQHAKNYTDLMMERFKFDKNSQVIEIACNDGYLLQYFVEKNIPVLGVEPAKNVAIAANEKGIPTIEKFFGVATAEEMAREKNYADLLIGNNVLAHVPDLNDFVKGMKIVLKPQGIITMEFPHLLRLIEENQFDTIYHEHFSYFSFITVNKVFEKHGLKIFDVEELSTHGGSLRIFACHAEDQSKKQSWRANDLIEVEIKKGFNRIEYYEIFTKQVITIKREILEFFTSICKEGKTVVGYGAPAKGNTLLNYCGIKTDFMKYTVDRSPHKQNLFLPGTRIPIYGPEKIKEDKPDYLLILPWNLKDEIMGQMDHIRKWGGKFVTLIPAVKVYS
jgi:2-polyprenyl-3-methyl-5-hydroxy-6-metoxy-1,4-benzoquinol methylase